MNIQLENADQSSQVILVQIGPDDYNPKVEQGLKDFRKNARIPGFRPGMVPAGMIKKMYGKAIKVEEVSKMVSEKLREFMSEKEIHVLGEPLPVRAEESYDWDTQQDFEFRFEIGLRPEVDLGKLAEVELPYVEIQVTDEILEKHIDRLREDFGKMDQPEKVGEGCHLGLTIQEVDDDGQLVEGGLLSHRLSENLDQVKEEARPFFLGLSKEESTILPLGHVVSDLKKAKNLFDPDAILPEDLLQRKFRFTIDGIWLWHMAEINGDFFARLFPENAPADEEAFREKVRSDLKTQLYKDDRDMLFFIKAREKAIEVLNPEIPEQFMKKWLLAVDTSLTAETVERSWKYYNHEIQWELIEGKIDVENNLEPEDAELTQYVASTLFKRYLRAGYNLTADQAVAIAREQMAKKEERKKFYEELKDKKLAEYFRGAFQVIPQEVSEKEFFNMVGYDPDATSGAGLDDHEEEGHEHDHAGHDHDHEGHDHPHVHDHSGEDHDHK